MPTIDRITSASPFEQQFGFCRALRYDDRILIAGTAPIGADGQTAGVGDVAAQTRRCFDIVAEALAGFGAGLESVVRTRMFLTHIDDWQTVGQVHGEYFGAIRPVATMVQVARLIDPDWRIEIEAEALVR